MTEESVLTRKGLGREEPEPVVKGRASRPGVGEGEGGMDRDVMISTYFASLFSLQYWPPAEHLQK